MKNIKPKKAGPSNNWPSIMIRTGLKTWKTIELGVEFRTADEFCKLFKERLEKGQEGECFIGDPVKDALNGPSFKISNLRTKIELVVPSLLDFGFKDTDDIPYHQYVACAEKVGLTKCPFEAALQLRLQYNDQPKNETVYFCMDPFIVTSVCRPKAPHLFSVGNNGCQRYIGACWTTDNHGVTFGTNMVFTRWKK